ncbi:MAG TPA: hypothetical protein VGF26_00960 [Ramlibacter sp.]
MPALPTTVEAARAAGTDVALAFAVESARTGAVPGARELFLDALATLAVQALDPRSGDPGFQALVVRAREPSVHEYVALQALAERDARAVRRLVDAVAHPGRLAASGDEDARLADLHRLAHEGRWGALRDRAQGVIDALPDHASLQRLARSEALQDTAAVASYLDLVRAQGPLAGSEAASERGRDAAQTGASAEAEVAAALQEMANALDGRGFPALRVARGLRTPRGFPGEPGKAKEEWDVALLASEGHAARIVLLGEVKASPAAAPADVPRLHRGLQRLAQAQAGVAYTFPSTDGPVVIAGESLQGLAPMGGSLPPQVLYFSTAPADQVPPALSVASKAMLLAEPGTLAFARARHPPLLEPVWDALRIERRLRTTLNQHDNARLACEAMLHPDDLLATFRALWPGT